MKNKIKVLITVILLFIGIWIILQNTSYASADFTLKQMDFNVVLNEDGSMNVEETWSIKVNDMTNTLFKTFNVDKTKYKEITDVKVSQIINGEDVAFTRKNIEVTHVDKNCYYGLINSNGKFEIAWGINETNGNKTYKIEYKVIDAIKNFNDCSELYWQFIGTDAMLDVDKVTGTITIPEGDVDKEEIRAWAHGPLNGNISIDSPSRVSFEVEYLDRGIYLELRMAMPTKLFPTNENTMMVDRFSTILEEENNWANEANALREQKRAEREAQQKTLETIKIAIIVIMATGTLFFATRILKYRNMLIENPKKQPSEQFEYFRDIPDENASPAQAAFLYYFDTKNFSTNMSKILSSTMLSLSMKNYIEFENQFKKHGKPEIVVHIKQGNKQLTEDEEIIYELLNKINNESFTMKDLEKYAKKHYSSFLGSLDKIENVVKKEHKKQNNFDEDVQKKGTLWIGKAGFYVMFTILGFVFGIIFDVPMVIVGLFAVINIICSIYTRKLGKVFNGLTQNGIDQQAKWVGLKKYMEDFSMIKDREVPELILWEKYLVYATAFGIADKVLKQLKVVYPQISDDDFNDGAFLGLMYYNGMHNSFIHSLENGVNSAYNGSVSARASYDYSNSSSGGGFGGGFSGGGGFGGGGRWLRRPLK